MIHNHKVLRLAFVLRIGALAGCDWFDGPPCEMGEQSCDGDNVRVCQTSSSGRDGKAYEWSTLLTCADDPRVGALTCGMIDGRAQCVPEGVDGGAGDASAAGADTRWARVVVARSGAQLSVSKVQAEVLSGATVPVSAPSGAVAAVSYSDGKPLDATLVRFAEPGADGANLDAEQVVWLAAEGANRIKLVNTKGAVLAEAALSAPSTAPKALIGYRTQALTSELPSTLRVLGPADQPQIPAELRSQMGLLVSPTSEMAALVSSALARAPTLGVSAVTKLGFVAFNHRSRDEDGGTEEPDAGTHDADGGVAEGGEANDLERPSTALTGTTVLVNVSNGWLSVYRDEPHKLALSLVREVALAYAALAKPPAPAEPTAAEYPEEIGALIVKRVSPLLAPKEGLLEAWAAIHKVGVDAQLAGPYTGPAWTTRDEIRAAKDGFFSSLGGKAAQDDFAETVAHLHVPEVWSDASPCRALAASSFAELDMRLTVPLAKIELVHALGLASDEVRRQCVGELGEDETKGLVLHGATGFRMTFNDQIRATRQPYLHGEIHLTMFGVRKGTTALMDISYRGLGVGVHRLIAVQSRSDPELGAGMFLANPYEYDSTFSTEGLIVVTRIDKKRVSARGLLVKQAKEMLGEKIWPLVTVRMDDPEWLEDM